MHFLPSRWQCSPEFQALCIPLGIAILSCIIASNRRNGCLVKPLSLIVNTKCGLMGLLGLLRHLVCIQVGLGEDLCCLRWRQDRVSEELFNKINIMGLKELIKLIEEAIVHIIDNLVHFLLLFVHLGHKTVHRLIKVYHSCSDLFQVGMPFSITTFFISTWLLWGSLSPVHWIWAILHT